VSRVVSRLEQSLGVRLLERSTRSLSLTEVGRELFERAVGILASVDDAERAVQRSLGEPRCTLRLSCGVEFGMLAVSGWIDRYLRQHAQVRVDADFSGRVVDIVHEGFDLAIRVGPLADSVLAARRLGAIDYALYAAPSYLARRAAPEDPAALAVLAAHETLLFAGASRQPAWMLRQGERSQRVELQQPRLVANNSFAVRDAAVAGLGIAQLPRLLGDPEERAGRLAVVLPSWTPPSVPVHAVFASARYLTPKVRAFIDLALQSFGEERGGGP
jgi:DNA-binding transcriptional LysR family regulator